MSKRLKSTSNKASGEAKCKSVSIVSKEEVRSKTSGDSSNIVSTVTTTITRKTHKKVFTLPGQRFDPPAEREPLRIFYESLSKQRPESELAENWLMEHGMLSPEKAKKAFEKKKQKRKKQKKKVTPNQASTK